jgi:predicted DNA-binding transcriptional regulator YafY
MRADRLLSILLLLQVHAKLTARELAKRLGVSERTIYRDMDALSAAGVPVYGTRGGEGGWSLLEDYKTTLTGLNASEIEALFVRKPPRLLADLGLDKAAEAALIKLLATLPDAQRQNAEAMRQRIHIDGAGWRQAEEKTPFLRTLREAVWSDRKIMLSYQRIDGVVERLADPLGLAAKGRAWYLVAAVDGDLRTYRVSRIQSVQITNQPCVRPPGFDLASYWEQNTAEFIASVPRYPIMLRADAEAIARMPTARGWGRLEKIEPVDDTGWAVVQVTCELIEDACEYVLGFGAHVEVLEPAELRERVLMAIQMRICIVG